MLILLPSESKLEGKWVGLYEVLFQVIPPDYEVATPGHKKQKEIYYKNFLKQWKQPPAPAASSLLAVLDGEYEDELGLEDIWDPEAKTNKVDDIPNQNL